MQLEVHEPGQQPRIVSVMQSRVVVGRAPDCDIVLASDAVSKHHVEFEQSGQQVWVRDLGSKNGTSLAGTRIHSSIGVAIEDAVVLGQSVTIRLVRAGQFESFTAPTLPASVQTAIEQLRRHTPQIAEDAHQELLHLCIDQQMRGSPLARIASRPTVPSLLRELVTAVAHIVQCPVFAAVWEGAPTPRFQHVILDREMSDPPPERDPMWRQLVGAAQAGQTRFGPHESFVALPLGAHAALGIQVGTRHIPAERRIAVECLARALQEHLRLRRDSLGPSTPGTRLVDQLPGVIGTSQAMRDLAGSIATAARIGWPILLLGERGVGKTLIARAIHQISRQPGRLVVGNCANLTESLAQSQLFGHERGSFTGATERHAGWLEQARAGTLFLEEIGDLPRSCQGRLLGALEDRVFRTLGDGDEQALDCTVVSATNYPIDTDAEQLGFRRDLYDRLASVVLRVPPLRERREDIRPLARHLHDIEVAHLRERGVSEPPTLTQAALEAMEQRDYPGNVRELRTVLRQAINEAIRTGAAQITSGHLPPASQGPLPTSDEDFEERIDAFRRQIMREAWDGADGNQTEAARRLGISKPKWFRLKKDLGL